MLQPAADNKNPPPLAALPFVAHDEGNATPRFVRPTLHHIPANKETLAYTKVPMGVFVSPMAAPEPGEAPVPLVDLTTAAGVGPPRCGRCKGYVNPFVTWLSGGNKWGCNLCAMVNDTPLHYRCPLDGSGARADAMERLELCRGSVDFAASSDYCVRPVQEPVYVFLVDATPAALECGFTKLCLDSAVAAVAASAEQQGADGKAVTHAEWDAAASGQVPLLPGGALAKVGLVAFDGKSVIFYRANPWVGWAAKLGAKKAAAAELSPVAVSGAHCVMSDLDDPFAPLPPDEWLVPLGGFVPPPKTHTADKFGATAWARVVADPEAAGIAAAAVKDVADFILQMVRVLMIFARA